MSATGEKQLENNPESENKEKVAQSECLIKRRIEGWMMIAPGRIR